MKGSERPPSWAPRGGSLGRRGDVWIVVDRSTGSSSSLDTGQGVELTRRPTANVDSGFALDVSSLES